MKRLFANLAALTYSALRKTVHGQLLLDIDTLEIHDRSCPDDSYQIRKAVS